MRGFVSLTKYKWKTCQDREMGQSQVESSKKFCLYLKKCKKYFQIIKDYALEATAGQEVSVTVNTEVDVLDTLAFKE